MSTLNLVIIDIYSSLHIENSIHHPTIIVLKNNYQMSTRASTFYQQDLLVSPLSVEKIKDIVVCRMSI